MKFRNERAHLSIKKWVFFDQSEHVVPVLSLREQTYELFIEKYDFTVLLNDGTRKITVVYHAKHLLFGDRICWVYYILLFLELLVETEKNSLPEGDRDEVIVTYLLSIMLKSAPVQQMAHH